MLTTVERLMYLRAIPTFRAVALETLRAVAEHLVAQRYPAGEAIVVEGEPGEHLYVVTEGRVAVSVGGRRVNELGPRQYFGEMALYDGGPRSATVAAAEDTTVLRLGRDALFRLGRQHPELLVGVIRVLSERLRTANVGEPDPGSGADRPSPAAEATAG